MRLLKIILSEMDCNYIYVTFGPHVQPAAASYIHVHLHYTQYLSLHMYRYINCLIAGISINLTKNNSTRQQEKKELPTMWRMAMVSKIYLHSSHIQYKQPCVCVSGIQVRNVARRQMNFLA